MKIETKFDLSQKVYYINGSKNKICEGFIYNIRFDSSNGITYFIPMLQRDAFRISEDELFASKSEAEQALKKVGK